MRTRTALGPLLAALLFTSAAAAQDKAPDCEVLDSDKDGIGDRFDKCVDDPEDYDTVADEDGCPEPDDDKDGICDPWVTERGQAAKYASTCKGKDACPRDPEDKDGHEDEDGCPEPDNDKDELCDTWVKKKGLLNKYFHICGGVDKCPNKGEVFNGVDDEDGCPDSVVKLETKKIVILQKVLFYFNKTKIKPGSYPLLDEVKQVLLDNAWITLVRVEGHTDTRGNPGYNKKLSQGRAKAVMAYLTEAGVEKKRLKSKGYGESKPIVKKAKTEAEHQRNRRVEFIILKQSRPAAK